METANLNDRPPRVAADATVWFGSVHEFALILDSNPTSGQDVAAILNRRLLYTAQVVSPHTGIATDEALPALVLAGIATDEQVVLDYLRALHRRGPGIPIVVYGPPNMGSIAAKAMNAGARYFLTTPVTEEALFEALDAVRESITGMVALAEVQATTVRRGRLITVFSPKGGSGATTIAVNMAASFAQQGFRTVLMDCNLNFGNVGIFYGMTPEKTMVDCVPTGAGAAASVIDPADVLRSITHHEASGVDLLLAPLRPEEGERITKSHFDQIIAILERSYARVIADTWTSYDDRVLELLDHADVVVVPVAPELPSVRNLGALSRVVKAIGLPINKFRWVLMRANTVVEADIEDLQSFLSLTIHHRVISDGRLVLASVQRGVPFVISHPESQVTRDVTAICVAINEQLGERGPISGGLPQASVSAGSPLTRAGKVVRGLLRRG